MEYYDLHTHSIYSDGTFSPAQLVAEGLRKKLRAVALTDLSHDCPSFTRFVAAKR